MILTGEISKIEYWYQALGVSMLVIVVGFFIGLIPSLIAAVIITKLKIYFDSTLKIIPLFIIGFFSTFLCVCWMVITTRGFLETLGVMSIASSIGGFSAVATGWFALPKHK